MILVDSSIWIGHFRSHNETLANLLEADWVLTHPFVIGELACNLKSRATVLSDLNRLPKAEVARHEEALKVSEIVRGKGVGWIDVHLIASALLSRARLWTADERLRTAAATAKVNTLRDVGLSATLGDVAV